MTFLNPSDHCQVRGRGGRGAAEVLLRPQHLPGLQDQGGAERRRRRRFAPAAAEAARQGGNSIGCFGPEKCPNIGPNTGPKDHKKVYMCEFPESDKKSA